MDQEYIALSRAWRDTTYAFRRRIDAEWFAYFEHLGLTPDYLYDGLSIGSSTFYPRLFVSEWRAFVYLLPTAETRAEFAEEARELSKLMPQFDVLIVHGKPDKLRTYIELYSASFESFLNSWPTDEARPLNRWMIAGTIDRAESTAYYWTLLNADDFGYVPATKDWYSICFCRSESCELCTRFEPFVPIDAYGTAFSISFSRHLQCEPRRKAKRSRRAPAARR